MKHSARWWGILGAVLLLSVALGVRWRNLSASTSVGSPVVSWVPPPIAAPLLLPATPFSPDRTALPQGVIALGSFTEAARTTFFALDKAGMRRPLTGPLVVDEGTATWRGQSLAYIVMPGLDPARNFIEARDFGRGIAWRVQPEAGHAIFGFALDPAGARLVYLEVNMQITGRRLPWWLVGLDLASGQKQLLFGGQYPDTAALAPVAWSGGTLLLQGIAPFSGERAGLWIFSMPDRQPTLLADETDYVGTPRLSPDGKRVALPVSDPAALPRTYSSGEPPATGLVIVEAETGVILVEASAPEGHIFTDLNWAPDGGQLWVIDSLWNQERRIFDRRAVAEIALGPAGQYQASSPGAGEIKMVSACSNGHWLAVMRGKSGTEVVSGPEIKTLATLAEPGVAIPWLVCLA